MLDWKIDVSAYRPRRALSTASASPSIGAGYTPPTWPPRERPLQMHLNVIVDDLDAAVAAVIDLGATKPPDQPGTSYVAGGAATAEADAVETREAALADRNAVPDLAAEWQGRLRRLVTADPNVATELRTWLDSWNPGPTTMRATASGRARIIQAGRDVHVTRP